MASSKIKGITIEIGGDTTKLGKAIANSEKNTKSLQGELKQVEKLLKFDPVNTELLSQKQEILARAVKETTDKLETLRKAQEQVENQFKNGDIGEDQYRAFQREIVKTENELKGFKQAADGTEDVIEDVGDAAQDSGDGFTIMKGALADMIANVISSAISSIGDLIGSLMDLSEATEEYRTMQAKLAGSADTFGYSVDFANEKYSEFYKYLGDDQAATNAITNLMGVGTSTESLSKLVDGATGAWATYGDSINVESLTEAVNETITCGKVTGSFADTINWCKDANDNLKSALGGNKDAQKAYNKAIKEGLPVEDAFNEALAKITDEQERADVVAKFLNDTYGESKKTYDELNGSVLDANEAELALKDTQAQLGETMAPVNTALTNMKDKALQAITPLVEKLADGFMKLYEWLQKNPTVMKIITAVVIALAAAFTILAGALAIQGLITGVTKAIAFLNTTLLANPIVLIIAAIAALVAAFIYLWNNCDGFREFWIKLWEKIKVAAGAVKDTLVKFFTVTIPEAFNKFKTKTVEVVTAVVDWFKKLPGRIWNAIVSAISNITKWASQMKTKATNGAKNVIDSVVNWFKQLPGKIWTWLSNAIGRVASWASNIVAKARSAGSQFVNSVVNFVKGLPGKIWSWLSNAASRVASWGSSLASKGKAAATKLLNSIVDTVKGIPSKIKSIGSDIVSGLWNGIGDKVSWLKNKVKGFVGDVTGWLKKFFKISSPSRVMRDEIGQYIAEGIGVGISENEKKPLGALKDLGDKMLDQEFNLNGATLGRRLSATFNSGFVQSADNTSLMGKLDRIYERLDRLQIVLDTGALVGETIDKIDAGLADRQLLSARGV